ncbi:MAG: Spx/MgsR family RNA polymerase-binding regulatory protein [Deltaproteobacteria bacterium]|nr:Spx/MgsR family RNA polymerase-binding regulatory protein [Deltaproteobacteria bacterium]
MSTPVMLLAYDGCDTCRKARKWLDSEAISHTVRPIVTAPPTVAELRAWVPASGVGLRKWLNTSGQSYRALGKAAVDAASDEALVAWLAADGKLVKRPVLVRGAQVLVGFDAARWEAALGG